MGAPTMHKITAPVSDYNGTVGDVQFASGVAVTDNEAVLAYCRSQGYTVEKYTAPRASKAVDARVADLETKLADAESAKGEAVAKVAELTAEVDRLKALADARKTAVDPAAGTTKPQGGTK